MADSSITGLNHIIYSEPLLDYNGPEDAHPRVLAYDLGPSDAQPFSQLRNQLTHCLAPNAKIDNSHLKTSLHYFENGDRKTTPCPLPGSFDAIEPLMSYEAALEALLVLETDNGGGILSKRAAALAKKANGIANDRAREVENFTKRVFWLRSKVAHGARPIGEIEDLIIRRPNDEIVDEERNKQIPGGQYTSLVIGDGLFFPGFLVNLRELTRICIRFFCDGLSAGRYKTSTIDLLKQAG